VCALGGYDERLLSCCKMEPWLRPPKKNASRASSTTTAFLGTLAASAESMIAWMIDKLWVAITLQPEFGIKEFT
jgi:hypothetical protein